MKITAVKIIIVPNEFRLKAYASITIDNCFIVHDIKVIRTDDKIFVAMPSKPDKHKNSFRDIAHPLNKETRVMIHQAVLDEYEAHLKRFSSDEASLSALNAKNATTSYVDKSDVDNSSTDSADTDTSSSNTDNTSTDTSSSNADNAEDKKTPS